jgi:hypothetical protein
VIGFVVAWSEQDVEGAQRLFKLSGFNGPPSGWALDEKSELEMRGGTTNGLNLDGRQNKRLSNEGMVLMVAMEGFEDNLWISRQLSRDRETSRQPQAACGCE